jgi:hypothetical protein
MRWPRVGEDEKRFNDWAVAELIGRAPDAAAECLDAALARDLKDGHGAAGVRRFAGALTTPRTRRAQACPESANALARSRRGCSRPSSRAAATTP